MKFVAVFVAILAVAAAAPPYSSWDSNEVSSASPLVQIIVNVNAAEAQPAAEATPVAPVSVGESVIPETPVLPTPVSVVEESAVVSPVAVVDQPAVSPVVVVDQPAVSPVVVVDQPAVTPIAVVDETAVSPVIVVDTPTVVEPVTVVEPEVDPIAIGEAVLPGIVTPINPVDVIAVAAPEVNPIDIIAPIAVVEGSDDGILV